VLSPGPSGACRGRATSVLWLSVDDNAQDFEDGFGPLGSGRVEPLPALGQNHAGFFANGFTPAGSRLSQFDQWVPLGELPAIWCPDVQERPNASSELTRLDRWCRRHTSELGDYLSSADVQ
jgi:hypothetical protein